MCIKKKLMAALLVAAMMVSTAIPVLATESPVNPPKKNPGYSDTNNWDNNLQDHNGDVLVRSYVVDDTARVIAVTHKAGQIPASWTALTVARNRDNKKVFITEIGDGSTGIFNSAKGKRVTKATIGSTKAVTVNANAFAGSNLKVLLIKSSLTIKADAYKGISNTALKQYLIAPPANKKAADYTFESGAFEDLVSTARFSVGASVMTSTEFSKLKTKLQKAGFKGQIYYTLYN